MVLTVLLVGCVATEGEERLPSPTATWTQIAEMSAAEIQLGEDGKYFIPDRGDGCLYTERGREPPMELSGGIVLPEVVILWADASKGCERGVDFDLGEDGKPTGVWHWVLP